MTRTERDSMGDMSLPDDVYYGIQTVRAIDNFKISGLKPLPTFVDACLLIKKATALVNAELGCIPVGMGMAINHQRRRVDALTVRVEAIEQTR